MSDARQPNSSAPPAVGGGFVDRRRQVKDTLLGDEPPRLIGATIIAIAMVLMALVVAAQAIEYEDTLPVSLTLPDVAAGPLSAIAYLKPQEALRVQRGQLVRIETEEDGSPISRAAQVSELVALGDSGLYAVRVQLPDAAAVASGDQRAPLLAPTPARIVTRRGKLFGKLFGVFRTVFGSR